ncbi:MULTISPECIES: pro-sigmaK processing inhibitor BofA family protein [unclassified Sporolactobacillus]|uniref:pro-sigmaK processing inhibitor BofA family protein n=1 Tax=unclassified Sporolactobacillus TaxID=2628533 RepID=UPI00236806A9|nr:pro-sigmaK processing inhibitor BofA family protein [Sporolactobacillus sp. CQH2019]MDD9150873.1 pro-sigmaK processing inhibitor BofA family protein [Sporolactobacillus sp. CQH2019]
MNNFLMIGAAVLVFFFLLLILGTSFHPLRWVGKLAVRFMVGALLLFLLNVIGESFSLHIPINVATAAVGGLLGIPGITALVLIKYTLGV